LNRNLLSFKDICLNGYHIETNNEGDIESLYITRIESNKKCVLEKLSAFSYGMYYTYINAIEIHVIISQKLTNRNEFLVWHDQLGHQGSIMMQKKLKTHLDTLLQTNEFSCTVCSQKKVDNKNIIEKLEMRKSHFQNEYKVIFMVQNTHLVDHFMLLIDASTRWSHIYLLSNHNQVFAKLLVQLRAHFPNYPIKKFVLIILVKLHLMLFMSIVYQLELELSIQ